MTLARHELTPAELSRMFESERAGEPFLAYRDAGAVLQLIELSGIGSASGGRRATI